MNLLLKNPNTGAEKTLERWCAVLTVVLLAAAPLAAVYTGRGGLLTGLWRIFTTPSRQVTRKGLFSYTKGSIFKI